MSAKGGLTTGAWLLLAGTAVLGCVGLPPATSAPEVDSGSHSRIELRRSRLVVDGADGEMLLDNPTAFCLECHAGDGEHPSRHSIGPAKSNHPVDVAYPQEERGGFVPAAALDERLLFVDGRMTCITCHDPQSTNHSLVIPNEESQICRACHQR